MNLCVISAFYLPTVIMGASQSKLPESFIEEKLIERLHDVKINESCKEADMDFIYLDNEHSSPNEYHSTVSISTTEQWEKELLEDPKVSVSSQ